MSNESYQNNDPSSTTKDKKSQKIIKTYPEKAAYTQMPTYILYAEGITLLDIKVYTAIAYYLGLNESFNKTYEDLSIEVCSTKSGVFKSVERLISKGFISKIHSDDNKKLCLILPQACGKLSEKVSQRKQKQQKKFPAGNKQVSQRKQKGSDTLYINKPVKKPVNKEAGFFNITEKEKKALELLRSKLNDNKISLGQTRDVLKLHSPEIDLAWSLDNYLYDLSNKNESIKNKVGVFTSRLQTYINKKSSDNFYPDTRNYTKDKDPKESRKREEPLDPSHQVYIPAHERQSKAKISDTGTNAPFDFKKALQGLTERNL